MATTRWCTAPATRPARGAGIDRQVIDACREVFWRAGRGVFVYASSAWVIGPTRGAVDESTPINPPEVERDRAATEQAVLESQGGGVRAIVVRPGLVYGGDSGVVSDMLRDACNGIVRVVGSGDNHWPLIYRDDLADLFVRLIAHADIAGVVHATDGSDDTVNDLVEAMSSHVTHKPEVRHMSIADARHRMGALAEALAMDQIVRSPKALAHRLGAQPDLGVAQRAPAARGAARPGDGRRVSVPVSVRAARTVLAAEEIRCSPLAASGWPSSRPPPSPPPPPPRRPPITTTTPR